MIVEWLLDLVTGFVGWVLGLFDDWQLPTELMSPHSGIFYVYSFLTSMGVWVPWAGIGVIVTITMGCYMFLFVVKLIKNLIAHVPGFGGSG